MSESVSFSLENRNCFGMKAAVSGEQVLVLYRDRYYVVTGGAAQIKGGKAIKFSISSLPTAWKRVLKGDRLPPLPTPSKSGIDLVTTTRPPKRERKKAEQPTMPEREQDTAAEISENVPAQIVKAPRKTGAKSAIQQPVLADCPYCNARHEIPVEKGENGKSFFISCSKCKMEFAVRFVQVTVYQAQVAGFR
jgi:hypothetical protein